MNEISAEEKQELAARIEYIGKFFEKNVGDNLKTYIFGGTKVSRYVKRVSDYVVYMNNIFSLAFIFARGCLRCDNDSDLPIHSRATKQSSLRIINSLRKAYVQYPATSELVQFVLSDIQFEMMQGPNGSELYELFENMSTFHSKDFNLSQYYKVIATWKAAPSRFNMNSNELAGMFWKLLQNMSFLKKYDMVIEEDESYFVEKEALEFGDFGKYSRVPISHLIFFDPDKYLDMYSLYSIERMEEDNEKKIGLRYVSGDGFKTLYFTVGEDGGEMENDEFFIQSDAEDYFYEIVGEEWNFDTDEKSLKKNSDFIDQVHAINYKYIKNLALAISDAISVNRGSKKALYRAFHIRHKDVFDRLPSGEDIESVALDWDGVIVMLLIEASPSSVLETLFRAVPQTFFTIANNLCKRIDNPEMPIYGLNEYELEAKVEETMKTNLIIGESGAFGKIPKVRSDERLKARAEALLIVSSLSSVLAEDSVEKSICAGNIYDNISLLRKMKGDMSPEQRCKYVCIILGETFRHLICFYNGLIEYGEIKGKFNAESCNSCFSEAKIAMYQKQMYTSFMTAAKEAAGRLRGFNSAEYSGVIGLIHEFIALCEKCGSSASSSMEGYKLYSAIGRHDILNVFEFKSYVIGSLNNLPQINESNVDSWITFALEILQYLRSGKLKGTADSPIHAIYPYSATYNRGNENYDGYKTVTFTLNFDMDGDGNETKEYINVLTEFTYSPSNVFYCLPNALRSNRKWWIDPVLINFKKFNEIFEDEEIGE